MLILTEKPSVAADFAAALGCTKSAGVYKNSDTVITNCIGHLFALEEPKHYGTDFPVIPEQFDYRTNPAVEKQAKFVLSILKSYKNDILIATDADREGEVIARECLSQAGINDFSRIRRFWVSEALTPDVVKAGIKNAKPLTEYDRIAEQGFARQRADWLTGMNFCRYISNAARTKLAVGRVQTAILSAIAQRCDSIKNFKSEKYFEHYGLFGNSRGTDKTCRGIYFEDDKKTGFSDNTRGLKLRSCIGQIARLLDNKVEKKSQNPPQLYNLNALQKDAFKSFGYTADKTLKIVQSLYEELKCVSYPRTPSRVMGSGNVELCRSIFETLCYNQKGTVQKSSAMLDKCRAALEKSDISLENKRVFNDRKLEAHHAIIPLAALPDNATDEQKNIYYQIYDRFIVAFLPPCEYEKQTVTVEVSNYKFRIAGKKIIKNGFKEFVIHDENNDGKDSSEEQEEESQPLDSMDWNNLILSEIKTKEKWTKAPPYFNEASILSFTENPKSLDESKLDKKLVGLGTPATRHTFIPKLTKYGYIIVKSKNFYVTPLGETLLKAVRSSNIRSLADVAATTEWEERLDENPVRFLSDIKTFVRDSVSKDINIEIPIEALPQRCDNKCPVCGKEVRKGKTNWYCTGYKEGCKFVLWENVSGAKLTEKDVSNLCSGKKTGIKHCKSKAGKNFDCRFELDAEKKIKFVFEEKRK